jgi:dTMP kinase
MTEINFYGYGLPGVKHKSLPGKLIVLEGTDGVGRSTQVALLKEWLESEGYAVSATGLKRGKLAGKGIQQAMEGHTLGDTTMNLFYATDMVDRLERDIIPALRAGFVVLTDRYIYSVIARALVRGADPVWIRNVFGFALVPDIIFYLQADLAHLIPRVLNARGFDYWETGRDFMRGRDYYESFVEYQTRLLAQFDAIADEFNFVCINANRSIREVFQSLQTEIGALIKGMKPPKQPKEAKKETGGKPKGKEEKKKAEEKSKEREREERKEEKKEAKKEKETAKTKETKK